MNILGLISQLIGIKTLRLTDLSPFKWGRANNNNNNIIKKFYLFKKSYKLIIGIWLPFRVVYNCFKI